MPVRPTRDRVVAWVRKTAAEVFAAVALVLALALPSAGQAAPAGGAIIVSSKIDTEGILLGNMILAALAAHGLPVADRLALGPTDIVRAAILSGQIDIYPEYTGNGALFFHQEDNPAWKNWKRGYELVKKLDLKKNHLVWLTPAPADNTWVIAVRQDLARGRHMKTMEDFARYVNHGGQIKLAASAEFVTSPLGLPAFEKAYGFHLSDAQLVTLSGGNTAATERAAAEQMSGVDAAMAYGTDGALTALHLVALADDKHAEIVYAPTPVVRAAVLRLYPAIAAALGPVFATLTTARLRHLNAKIAVAGKDAAAVAAAYLKAGHFLP